MDRAGREMEEEEEEVTEQFAGGAVRRFVLLRYGNDPEISPGRLRACRHFDRAG